MFAEYNKQHKKKNITEQLRAVLWLTAFMGDL